MSNSYLGEPSAAKRPKIAENEPLETSIDIFSWARKNRTLKPNATQAIRVFWRDDSKGARPTLTHMNEFELEPGLSVENIFGQEDQRIHVHMFQATAQLMLKNTNSYNVVLNHKDPIGTITKGTFGPYPCAVFSLNMKQNQLSMYYLQKSGWDVTFLDNFDVFNGQFVPEYQDGKFTNLNYFSKSILEILRWPKFTVMFVFSTEQEAKMCLNLIFPRALPKDMDLSNLKIKIHILHDAEKKKSLIKEKMEKNGFKDFPCKIRTLSDPVDPGQEVAYQQYHSVRI